MSGAITNNTCQICLDPMDKEGNLTTVYYSHRCKPTLCRPCTTQYFQMNINDSFPGMVPYMKCPICLQKIGMHKWINFVEKDDIELYQQRASALCEIRCGQCHNTGSLLPDVVGCVKLQLKKNVVEQLPKLRQWLRKYYNHNRTADDVFSYVKESLGAYEGQIIDGIINITRDPERRAGLLLQRFKHCPKTFTQCCSAPVCFECKTNSHHYGETCTEVIARNIDEQRKYWQCNLDDLIVQCSQCQIQLVKGDGCDSVICVCGNSFLWSSAVKEAIATRIELALIGFLGNPKILSFMQKWLQLLRWRARYRKSLQLLRSSLSVRLFVKNNTIATALRRWMQRFQWKTKYAQALQQIEKESERRRFVFIEKVLQKDERTKNRIVGFVERYQTIRIKLQFIEVVREIENTFWKQEAKKFWKQYREQHPEEEQMLEEEMSLLRQIFLL